LTLSQTLDLQLLSWTLDQFEGKVVSKFTVTGGNVAELVSATSSEGLHVTKALHCRRTPGKSSIIIEHHDSRVLELAVLIEIQLT